MPLAPKALTLPGAGRREAANGTENPQGPPAKAESPE